MSTMQPVPPMTDPYGEYWSQPDPNTFLFDDTHVLMTRDQLRELPEYTITLPTGTYVGKMWRSYSGRVKHVADARVQIEKDAWMLCWYEDCEDPTRIAIKRRTILLLEDHESKSLR
jgi:hypothetical protein